jgi:hypothetical protein
MLRVKFHHLQVVELLPFPFVAVAEASTTVRRILPTNVPVREWVRVYAEVRFHAAQRTQLVGPESENDGTATPQRSRSKDTFPALPKNIDYQTAGPVTHDENPMLQEVCPVLEQFGRRLEK